MRTIFLRAFSVLGSSKYIHFYSCVLCFGLLGCQAETAPKQAPAPSKPNSIELIQQDLVQAKTESVVEKIGFTGTIRAVQQSSIQAQVMASVTHVNAQVGQTVQSGQLLVQLNNQDNAARLAQAQANLASAQAQARQSHLMVQRKKRLYDQGFIAKTEYEQSAVDHQAQVENVKAQQASVDIAAKANQDGNILSPISGIITKRTVEPGQTVSVGQTLFEIVNPQQLEIQAQLPSEQGKFLRVGADIEVQLSGSQEKFSAKLTRFSPIADQNNRQIEFYATPVNPLPAQSIGAFVEGKILQPLAIQGFSIPLNSIQTSNQQKIVWVVHQQKIIKRPVHVLHQDNAQNQAIVEGIEANDQIIMIQMNENDLNKTALITAH